MPDAEERMATRAQTNRCAPRFRRGWVLRSLESSPSLFTIGANTKCWSLGVPSSFLPALVLDLMLSVGHHPRHGVSCQRSAVLDLP